MRVLIVDDSVVFRTSISTALSAVPGIEVAGTAANGEIALQKLAKGSIDLITLDMEMPGLNGIDVLKEIKRCGYDVKVIVFSSQTPRGADAALNALREGAHDVVAKPSGDQTSFDHAAESIRSALLPKIQQFITDDTKQVLRTTIDRDSKKSTPSIENDVLQPEKKDLSKFRPTAVVVGCSTGGPAALEDIFSKLTPPSRVPILIVQHMPPVFTAVLAKRLSELSGMPAAEAVDGEPVLPGRIYIAPGDYHMMVTGTRDAPLITLNKNPQRNYVRPAVDYLFESAAELWGASLLGYVLTGMGEDGLQGAKAIRNKGGGIVIQDEESCVVFGMPGAIFRANSYDSVLPLKVMSMNLQKAIL